MYVLRIPRKPDYSCRKLEKLSSLAAPGIVCGYWLEPINGIGTSVLVFENKEHAEEAAKYPVPPMPGVTQLDLTVREVFACV